jgi:hypothetical protein
MRNYKLFMSVYVIITTSAFIFLYIYRMQYLYPDVEPMIYYKDNFLANVQAIVHYKRQ